MIEFSNSSLRQIFIIYHIIHLPQVDIEIRRVLVFTKLHVLIDTVTPVLCFLCLIWLSEKYFYPQTMVSMFNNITMDKLSMHHRDYHPPQKATIIHYTENRDG